MPKIEEYNGIKVIPIKQADDLTIDEIIESCSECALLVECCVGDGYEFPCSKVERHDGKDVVFRQATPEEIQQASIDDAVEVVSKAMPKLMEIPCSDEPQGRKK